MFFIVKFLVALAIIAVLLGVWRTWKMEHSSYQEIFSKGTLPSPAPEGLYNGRVPGQVVPWRGKKFYSATNSGINVFDGGNNTESEKYPFKTSVGKGVHDKDTDVLKIDYNTPDNPWWLHPVLDEIVQVDSNKYLGKLHVRIIPGYPFTLAYFELNK